jgi:hypothetical protein
LCRPLPNNPYGRFTSEFSGRSEVGEPVILFFFTFSTSYAYDALNRLQTLAPRNA